MSIVRYTEGSIPSPLRYRLIAIATSNYYRKVIMSPKTATRKGAKTGKARKGIPVVASTLGDALRAPDRVVKGKERGFGSGYKDAKQGVKVTTDVYNTLIVLLSLWSSKGSWMIDAKTGEVEGGKAKEYIQDQQVAGVGLLEASIASKEIYLAMGKMRNRYIDELKELGIKADSYESVVEALKALAK